MESVPYSEKLLRDAMAKFARRWRKHGVRLVLGQGALGISTSFTHCLRKTVGLLNQGENCALLSGSI